MSDNHDNFTTEFGKLSVKDSKMPAARTPMVEANALPFHLQERDVEVLAQSEGFAILREHLAEHYADEYVLSLTTPNRSLTNSGIDSAPHTRPPPPSPPNSTSSPAISYTPSLSPSSSSSTKPPPSPSPQPTPPRSSSSSTASPVRHAAPSFGCNASSRLRKSANGATPKAVRLAWSSTH